MIHQLLEEARNRRDDLQRELKVLDDFLAFYEDKSAEPIPASLTLSKAGSRRLLSVRVGNALYNHYGKEKFETMTFEELIKDIGGYPLSAEFESQFLRWPNVGRKALNKLKDILSRVTL